MLCLNVFIQQYILMHCILQSTNWRLAAVKQHFYVIQHSKDISIPLQTNLVTARISVPYTFCSLSCHTLCNLEKKRNIYTYKFRYIKKQLVNWSVAQTRRFGTYWNGTDAARLRADDATHRTQSPVDVVVQDELGDLSGLPTPRLPAHHQHLVRVDEPDQLLMTGTTESRWHKD